MKIKVNDTVAIISGKFQFDIDEKGNKIRKVAKVLKVLPKQNKVVCEGVNVRKKHQKPSQQHQTGQIVEVPMPIDASNVMLYDPKVKKPVKVNIITKEVKGKICKIRVSKKSDHQFD